MQLGATLQAIRPCRESETGWTPEAFPLPGNQSSLALNERGPALKVFWTRRWRDGRNVGEPTRLPKATRVVKNDCPRKPSRREQDPEQSRPLLSVRKWGSRSSTITR